MPGDATTGWGIVLHLRRIMHQNVFAKTDMILFSRKTIARKIILRNPSLNLVKKCLKRMLAFNVRTP